MKEFLKVWYWLAEGVLWVITIVSAFIGVLILGMTGDIGVYMGSCMAFVITVVFHMGRCA